MNSKLFICSCQRGSKLNKEEIDKLKELLGDKKLNYTEFEDLCGTATKEAGKLDIPENSVLIGCQPRAMENLLKYSEFNSEEKKINFFHIADILSGKEELTTSNSNSENVTVKYSAEWKPWFPVLDYEKCTNCKQCMDFCLFGVYELDENKLINVKSPDKCKDLCPACARVCPAQAIIFPKHDASPIDGGPGELEVDPQFADMKKEDVYKILMARRRRLKAHLLKKNQLKLAEEEREKCSEGQFTNIKLNVIQDVKSSGEPCCPPDSAESCGCNCECAGGSEKD